MTRFIVLSGPSCIGKGPLCAALGHVYPALAATLTPLVLYNDRAPRPAERDGIDYHFRPRDEIEALRDSPDHLVVEVRADLQALETDAVGRIIDSGADAFYEGSPYMVGKMREAGLFERFETLTVFLSPLSKDELLALKAPERGVDLSAFVAEVQRRKLLHRTRLQKGDLTDADLEDIERRATSAFREMHEAHRFDHVIPLHDGEGNGNWDVLGHPVGSARQALDAFAALLQGRVPPMAERWEPDFL